ncbi:hypothetical protein [Ktedonobacter robiniae]|uniref:Uncharacterized protein n=1 Tax=Ktedonobacter robiniae TaxID=2778365 RepID=A0ABQ3UZS8_9CHLR|nr:hypothetical protein [Ktedonobacter robiniae]GHO58364.1 hypothetical protein KSB_68390 [Ktedonobacter robiniae]
MGREAHPDQIQPTSVLKKGRKKAAKTAALLREGMAQTGASDLLSYLLAAGEREARHLRSQARRHDSEHYGKVKGDFLSLLLELISLRIPWVGMQWSR